MNSSVLVEGGQTVPYDYLIIATGAVNTSPADPPVSRSTPRFLM